MGLVYAQDLAFRVRGCNLVAACDLNPAFETSARELGVSSWYADYRDLINDKNVDAVAVITSTSSHCEIVVEAARAGKAIFCEKPLSISLEEANNVQEVVAETGVFFHMAF